MFSMGALPNWKNKNLQNGILSYDNDLFHAQFLNVLNILVEVF